MPGWLSWYRFKKALSVWIERSPAPVVVSSKYIARFLKSKRMCFHYISEITKGRSEYCTIVLALRLRDAALTASLRSARASLPELPQPVSRKLRPTVAGEDAFQVE